MADWLAPALAYIPQWIAHQRRITEMPGIAVAVAQGGKLVLDQAFGLANLATGEALTPKHLFRVASHSKTFTAVGIMRLLEAGKLRLDDAAGQYVQGLHPEVAKATIAQLLSHTAGIVRDGDDTGQWADRRPFLNEAELRAALAEAPVIPANTRMKYSNHAFGLAGLVIAAVTGEDYNSWIAREVVKKAGLENTAPDAPVGPKVKTSRGHSSKWALGERLVIPADNCTHALASATGFLSTAGDLARFYATLDPAAPKSIISAASRREMVRQQWPVPDTAGDRHYGLGTIHGRVGDWEMYGHSGGFQGVRTQTATIPSQKLTVSMLTNAADGNPALLLEGVVHILRAFQKHGAPGKAVAGWTGRWWSLWDAVDLVPMGNTVFVAVPGQANPFADVSELEVTGADVAVIRKSGGFGSHGEAARLVRGRGGKVGSVVYAGGKLVDEAAIGKELRARYAAG
jgi:CubicO group peptidase (beta-lactamase class C family)